jgi:hypothetical protein
MHEAAGGRELASGETKHIFCNRQLRATKLPSKYRPFFGLTAS